MDDPLRLITTERGHLFRIANILADALPQDTLMSATDPVMISVGGSYGAGKKIFTDALRNKLLPDRSKRALQGRLNYDELWTGPTPIGNHGQSALQVAFLNAAWSDGYADQALEKTPILERAAHFQKNRAHGGITLVHNDSRFAGEKAWINIWLESKAGEIIAYKPQPRIRTTGPEARFIFNRLSDKKPWWTRYVEIQINHPRLLASPQTKAALDRLTQSAEDIYKLRDKKVTTYAYARKDPRMNTLQRAALAMGWY